MQTLRTGPAVVTLLNRVTSFRTHRVLGGNHHLRATAGFLDPLANPLLAFAALVGVGGVDKVAAEIVEGVQELEGRLLRAFAHKRRPGVAETCNIVNVGKGEGKHGKYLDVLMPPRQRGLTRTEADGQRSRCLPSRLFGAAGGKKAILTNSLLFAMCEVAFGGYI
jgi:hypothetical protein